MWGGGGKWNLLAKRVAFILGNQSLFFVLVSPSFSPLVPSPKTSRTLLNPWSTRGFLPVIREVFLPAVAKCLLMWDHQIVGIFSQFSWIFTLKYKVP